MEGQGTDTILNSLAESVIIVDMKYNFSKLIF